VLRMPENDIEIPLAEFYVDVLIPGGRAEVGTGEIA
jgi:hypothetical protein